MSMNCKDEILEVVFARFLRLTPRGFSPVKLESLKTEKPADTKGKNLIC